MKKLIVLYLLFFATASTMAAGIKFAQKKTLAQLIAQAKKEKKIIFLDAYASWCGPCKYLQKDVFTADKVGAFFNTNFINVAMDMEIGEGPKIAEKFKLTAYPTLFFIDGDGKLLHKYVGALDADELINLGKEALNPKKQYYVLKARAQAGNIEPYKFLEFVIAAQKIDDKDVNEIIKKYVEKAKYPFLQKDMLSLIMVYADDLSEEMIKKLYLEKKNIINILGINDDDFNQNIVNKVSMFALFRAIKDNVIDFESYQKLVAGFEPDQAELLTQKTKVNYYFFKEDEKSGLNELAKLISDPKYKLSVVDLSNQVADRAKVVADAKRVDEFVQLLENYSVNTLEAPKAFYRDFAIFTLYYYADDKTNMKKVGDKIVADPYTTAKIKEVVAKLKAG